MVAFSSASSELKQLRPDCASMPSAPMNMVWMSMFSRARLPVGPTSENQSPRSWPPVTKTFTSLRLDSSMAMFTVLVTTVTLAPRGRARMISAVVVPGVMPMVSPGLMRAAAEPLLFEKVEVAADGDDGDAELRAEVVDGYGSVFLQAAQDGLKALLLAALRALRCFFRFGGGFFASRLNHASAPPNTAESAQAFYPWFREPSSI